MALGVGSQCPGLRGAAHIVALQHADISDVWWSLPSHSRLSFILEGNLYYVVFLLDDSRQILTRLPLVVLPDAQTDRHAPLLERFLIHFLHVHWLVV